MKKLMLLGLVLLVVLIAGCTQQTTQYVCSDGSTVSNPSLCPKTTTQPSQPASTQPQSKSIEVSSLTNFVKTTIHNYFSSSSGAFFKFGEDINQQIASGHYCWTGFSKPCTAWIYPSQTTTEGDILSQVFDFGKGDGPTVSDIQNWQATFPGVEKRTLSDGDVIVQAYGVPQGYHDYMFEVEIPCTDQYWVTVSTSSSTSIAQGPFLAIADDVLKFCK